MIELLYKCSWYGGSRTMLAFIFRFSNSHASLSVNACWSYPRQITFGLCSSRTLYTSSRCPSTARSTSVDCLTASNLFCSSWSVWCPLTFCTVLSRATTTTRRSPCFLASENRNKCPGCNTSNVPNAITVFISSVFLALFNNFTLLVLLLSL